jgi:hypothetical protein
VEDRRRQEEWRCVTTLLVITSRSLYGRTGYHEVTGIQGSGDVELYKTRIRCIMYPALRAIKSYRFAGYGGWGNCPALGDI